MNTKTKIKCKYTLQRHSHIHLPHQHICSIEGELFGKYLTTDSSDPSSRIGRSIVRTYTSKHTSSYLLPLCSNWFFPTQYCTAPACSADCTSRTERGEGRRGGGRGGRVVLMLLWLCSSARSLLKRHTMKKTRIRHEEDLRDTGVSDYECRGYNSRKVTASI